MPGIESDRASGIQIGPIASIGTEVQPTPAIGDLMDAFKQGFITVDDLKKRAQQERLGNDAEKTQLQASDFQRRLAPGAFQNAQAAQGLQASQIQAAGQILPGATALTLGSQVAAQQEQDRQAALTSDDAARHAAAVEDATKRQYIDVFGHEPPKTIEIPAVNPEPVDDFNTWLEKEHGADLQKEVNNFEPGVPDPKDHEQIIVDKINNFKSGFPLNSVEDNTARAKFANALELQIKSSPTPDQLRAQFANEAEKRLREDPAVRTAYENYKVEQSKQTDKIVPGSPAYAEVLRQRVQDAQDKAALRAAKLTAVPKILEEQAKAPGEAAKLKAAIVPPLQKEYGTRQEIQDLRKVQAAYYKLANLLDPNSPPTAAKDQGAIFSWMKILDPGSTVREGEYATAKNARGVPEKITAFWNQALSGQILTAPQRLQFKEAVEPVYLGQVQAAAPTIRQFIAAEDKNGATGEIVPPEDAALIKRLSPAAPAAGVKPPPDGGPINRTRTSDGARFLWDGATWVHQP